MFDNQSIFLVNDTHQRSVHFRFYQSPAPHQFSGTFKRPAVNRLSGTTCVNRSKANQDRPAPLQTTPRVGCDKKNNWTRVPSWARWSANVYKTAPKWRRSHYFHLILRLQHDGLAYVAIIVKTQCAGRLRLKYHPIHNDVSWSKTPHRSAILMFGNFLIQSHCVITFSFWNDWIRPNTETSARFHLKSFSKNHAALCALHETVGILLRDPRFWWI